VAPEVANGNTFGKNHNTGVCTKPFLLLQQVWQGAKNGEAFDEQFVAKLHGKRSCVVRKKVLL
jgi:hypothetical protein